VKVLHKDVCVDMARIPQLVSLYVTQPKLAQLVRSIDLFQDTDNNDERKPGLKSSGTYMLIIRSSGITKRLQRMLKYDLRRRNRQAHMALLLLQTPNLQGLFLGEISHRDIRFLDPLFFNSSAATADPVCLDADYCRPYLRVIIEKRLKSRLNKLEMPFDGLWDSFSGPQSFDLSNYAQLTHVTTCADQLMTPSWKAWGAEPVYEFSVLPRTLTHLTFGGTCWDLCRLLAYLAGEKANQMLPRLRNLIVYTQPSRQGDVGTDRHQLYDRVQSDPVAAHFRALEDVGITATLRYNGLNHIRDLCRLTMGETDYQSRHELRRLEALEMRGSVEHWQHKATATEAKPTTREYTTGGEEQPKAYELSAEEEQPNSYEPSAEEEQDELTNVVQYSEASWDGFTNLTLND
jgi:hypothetical protein